MFTNATKIMITIATITANAVTIKCTTLVKIWALLPLLSSNKNPPCDVSAIEAITPKMAAYDIPIHGAFGSFLLFEYLNIFTMKKIDVRVYVVKNAFANRANPLDKSESDELLIIARTKLGRMRIKPAMSMTRCFGDSFIFFTSEIFSNNICG